MCKFRPFNKHLLVSKIIEREKPNDSPVLIPDGAKLTDEVRYGIVKFICAAPDCDRFLKRLNPEEPSWAIHEGSSDDEFLDDARKTSISLVVDKSMIENVVIDKKEFHVVHQNYVVGVVQE